jgi:hypothetical protein
MSGTSLVFIVMPIIASICLAVLIALPFVSSWLRSRGRSPWPPQCVVTVPLCCGCWEPDISATSRPRFSQPR